MEVKNCNISLSKEKSELGKNFIQNGKFSEAEKVLKQAVDLNPKNADAHFWQGVLLFNQDNFENAIETLMRTGFSHKEHKENYISNRGFRDYGICDA